MHVLDNDFVNSFRSKKVAWGYNGLGYIVYKRTYSRLLDNGNQEEWCDTIKRCIDGAQEIGADYTNEEAKRLFEHMFHFKCSFGGRLLWQLGTETVRKYGANSLLNCWGVAIRKYTDFEFIFENLMLGGGVGFSVRREDIHELPRIKRGVVIEHHQTKDADFIVPDSRKGWVALLHKVLEAYFETGIGFSYSTILIRSAGEAIKGFGGTASGPKILVDGLNSMCAVLSSREGKKLRSVDVLDLCNIIGMIVVSGNVRRSAQISLGDPDDYLFLHAKRWDLGNVPNWRAMSNNTIYADSFSHISDDVWKGYAGNGEPYGFFNLPLSRRHGRLGDGVKDNCEVINPCAESLLASYECCNLSELFLNNITSKDELIDCAKLLYKTNKAVNSLNFIHEETNKIVHKNMRLGIGVTGICQSLQKLEWLDDCYRELRMLDKHWSSLHDWPESIKLTVVKPSGSLSLLAGATPGVHPGYSKFYIRRIRMASTDKLVPICKAAGFFTNYVKNFDGTRDYNTIFVEVPCASGSDALVSSQMTPVAQLELVKKMQTVWADNSVSVTVYYKKEDLLEIQNWLKENYESSVKTVSFLLHNDHGFDEPPYEEITEDAYTAMINKIDFESFMGVNLSGDALSVECEGGVCPVK